MSSRRSYALASVVVLMIVWGSTFVVTKAAMQEIPSLQAWLGTLFLGTVASAAAFVVYGRALRELDASLVGAYVTLDPIVGVLTAVVFLGETLRGWQMLGGVVALTGMWLAASNGPKPSSGQSLGVG